MRKSFTQAALHSFTIDQLHTFFNAESKAPCKDERERAVAKGNMEMISRAISRKQSKRKPYPRSTTPCGQRR